ncbi:hypothetical protein BT96DRAFT_945646 [Gymnopus androsaceus JB14]|uniref:Alpha-type protein kinase domain-containing protein n=1 Tax=Gymnopus androsaceus JB14 TaxID=1447944 RepID=A0A6A4GYZ0_9AGAR|nr:hypothetical protein BT96DRAFT_945646 [Gymnopus androsaceus JB14]
MGAMGAMSSSDVHQDLSATIGDAVFSAGKTKHVYKLVIMNELMVAKKFFNCGNGIGEVSAAENESFLVSEITRLKSIAWILDEFKDTASVKGVDISQDITVTEAWIFRESNITASKASGLFANGSSGSAVWLVEPRRTKAVDNAFSHYVYIASKKTFVLADVQGSIVNIQGIDTIVLFDMMMHTTEQDSGVGDCGKPGINTFTEQHICTYMCGSLGFELMNQVDDE